ncbi:hypothetical protein [Caballeronia mineralivorans]|jgi:hypothetical protein|uniref:hypothetical protein n=1 Tax=Caballeronia mineralivorans TaxID=2010198 RepID=UPI0023F08A3A|nr:hypothetical protein [Caballeronia mineralivorans]MDB5780980.1 hypothetical protein [Caballeronia mineralivorans]
MIRSQATIADARELQTQLCAYNSAFEELDLMFRWDVDTLQSLARAPGDHSRIAQYIDTHCPHLLKAYSAEFLCQAIVDKKNAHYEACRATDIARADDTHGARMWRSTSAESHAESA